MTDNGPWKHVISVLNWAPFEVFERVVGHLLLEHAWTDHPGGTWERMGDRIEARLVSAFQPDLKKFAWMEATRGPNLPPVTLLDIKHFAARATAIGASRGVFVTTARVRRDDVDEMLKIKRPPVTILDAGMIALAMEVENIDLQYYLDKR